VEPTSRLKGVLEGIDKPFIELLSAQEIRNRGWVWKIAAFVALLQQGLLLPLFKVFVACREIKLSRESGPLQSSRTSKF